MKCEEGVKEYENMSGIVLQFILAILLYLHIDIFDRDKL